MAFVVAAGANLPLVASAHQSLAEFHGIKIARQPANRHTTAAYLAPNPEKRACCQDHKQHVCGACLCRPSSWFSSQVATFAGLSYTNLSALYCCYSVRRAFTGSALIPKLRALRLPLSLAGTRLPLPVFLTTGEISFYVLRS